ncbi:MAG TPA: FtsX-like permease family protein, partial [Paenibacillus sp.]|nr:FtsX-like permease family protein [Paenibacillus sp.]
MMLAGAGLFACALLLYLAHRFARYPHLRRMAWRNVRAQGRSAALTALGLAVSTALISMTLISNASLNRSAEASLERHYGPIAYDAPSTDQPGLTGPYFEAADVERIGSGAEASAGALPVVAFVSSAQKRDARSEPVAVAPNVHVVGVDRDAAVRFDPALATSLAEAPAPGEALLPKAAANALGVRPGDTVYLLDIANRAHPFLVRQAVEERGLAGYRGMTHAASTVLLGLDDARKLTGMPAGAYSNVLLTEAPPAGWEAIPVREDAERMFKEATQFLSAIFGVTSANAVLIGIVLITNIFKMLAEERRQEMGILRAVGLGRKELRILLRTEGLLYGFFSSTLGVALGLGLAYFLTETVGRTLVDTFSEEAAMDFGFYAEPGALMTGFAAGLLIVFACVWAISRKATKFSIVEALQPPKPGGSGRGRRSLTGIWALVLSGALAAALLVVTGVPDLREELITEDRMGPVLLGTLLSVPLFSLVFVQLFGFLSEAIIRALRRFPSLTLTVRLAFRNMIDGRVRTGLLLFMFAAVSCFVSFPLVYTEAIDVMLSRQDPKAAVGGYDLLARDARALTTEDVRSGLEDAGLRLGEGGYEVAVVQQLMWRTATGEWGEFYFKINGIDASYAATTDLALWSRDERFADDRAAWRALAEDPNAVIVAGDALSYSSGGPYRVGDAYPVRVGEKTIDKTIIGIAHTSGYHPESFGIWLRRDALTPLAKSGNDLHATVFVKLPKDDAAAMREVVDALSLQSVAPVVHVANSESSYYLTGKYLIGLFQAFNQFALFIGLTGLLVVMFRLVRQRRQQLGMLRAVGVSTGKLYGIVLLEGAFIGGFGILLGFAIGTYMSYIVFDALMAADLGGTLPLPWGTLLLYAAGTLAVAAALAGFPARQALRVSPSEATRYAG